MSSVQQDLSQVQQSKNYQQAMNDLIVKYYKAKNIQAANQLAEYILGDEQGKSLQIYISLMSKENLDNNSLIQIGNYVTQKLGNKLAQFPEQDFELRKVLADVYFAKKNAEEAARVLSIGPIDKLNVHLKCERYVAVAEYYLEADDAVNAEMFHSKAAMIIHLVQDFALNLRSKVCYARILDAKRKFFEASLEYMRLSQQANVDQSDLIYLLDRSVTCAILASAGPKRSRVLANLYKDERTSTLQNFEILKKMYMDRFLRKVEVQKFSDSLQPHQKAITASGFTVLEKAIIEHNVVAISKIYSNISFDELGNLLQVTPEKAEEIVANMALENRIKATLDQIERFIEFEEDEPLQAWDTMLTNLCYSIDDVIGCV